MSWDDEWVVVGHDGDRVRKASVDAYTKDYAGGINIHLNSGKTILVGASLEELDMLLGRDKYEEELKEDQKCRDELYSNIARGGGTVLRQRTICYKCGGRGGTIHNNGNIETCTACAGSGRIG